MTPTRQSQSSERTNVDVFCYAVYYKTGICYITIINHSVRVRKMKGFFPMCLFDLGFGHFDPLAYPYRECRRNSRQISLL